MLKISHIISLLGWKCPLTSHLHQIESHSPRNGPILWGCYSQTLTIFSPPSFCSSHTGFVAVLWTCQASSYSRGFPLTLFLPPTFPIICIAHSLISLGFLFKCQLGLSLATQSKVKNFPHTSPILLPPLCFYSCKPYYHLPFHLIYILFLFIFWNVEAKNVVLFTFVSSAHRKKHNAWLMLYNQLIFSEWMNAVVKKTVNTKFF